MARPAVIIAIIGVAIGTMVMVISLSVILAFKQSIHDKAVGFAGDIQVLNALTLQSAEVYPIEEGCLLYETLQDKVYNESVSRYTDAAAILKTNNDFIGVNIHGVAQEWDSTFIHNNIKDGSIPLFTDSVASNSILLSQSIATKLKVKTGEQLYAYFFDGTSVRTRKMTVTAIYQTNLAHYDDVTCISDLYTTTRVKGWKYPQIQGLTISINKKNNLQQAQKQIQTIINNNSNTLQQPLVATTIQDLNPQIFAWLDLLDMNVIVILILMITVASIMIISGILILILERIPLIAILKTLGAQNNTLQQTFICFGTYITLCGIIIGDILALAIIILQKYTEVLRLNPQTYYVDAIPVTLNPLIPLSINALTITLSLVILILPTLIITHLTPTKALRFE